MHLSCWIAVVPESTKPQESEDNADATYPTESSIVRKGDEQVENIEGKVYTL